MLCDLRYVLRTLTRTPGFALTTIGVLAIGIGASTSVFSVANYFLFRPLPVLEPDRLVRVYANRGANMTYPEFAEYRDRNQTLEGMAAFTIQTISLRVEADPEPAWAELVSGEYFTLLGINAAVGRVLRPDEGMVAGSAPVAVLSDTYWRQRLGGDAGVVGRTIRINGIPFTVVGVAPSSFRGAFGPIVANLWIPITMDPALRPGTNRLAGVGGLQVIGRLRDGSTLGAAQADLSTIAADLARTRPETLNRTVTVYSYSMLPGQASTQVAAFMGLLLAVVGIVLLIACTNVANLLLARGAGRRQEMALRQALGAGRWTLVRQLLTESLVLSLAAGAAGVIIARWTTDLLMSVPIPAPLPIVLDFQFDTRVLGFALVLSLVTTLLCGLAPAFHTSRVDVVTSLKDANPRAGDRRSRLRSAFVIAQVSLSLLLLVGAGLFLRSLRNVTSLDLGMDLSNVLTLTLDMETRGYSEDRARAFYRDLLDRLTGITGVTAAHLADTVPLTMTRSATYFRTPRQTQTNGASNQSGLEAVLYNAVTPGHFSTLRIPIIAGRDFDNRDTEQAPRVVIINETLAQHWFRGQTPLGQQILRGIRPRLAEAGKIDTEPLAYEIVGVVRNAKYTSMGEEPPAFAYFPLSQEFMPRPTLMIRTAGNPLAMLPTIRRVIEGLDAELPIFNVETLMAATSVSLLPARVAGTALGVMGALALILAALGLYAVISFIVRQRTREIGIRMSLGARPADIARSVMGQSMRWVMIGLAIGLALALPLTSFVRAFLYGIAPLDPLTFTSVVALLTIVGLASSYLPARRAIRVSPATALRSE